LARRQPYRCREVTAAGILLAITPLCGQYTGGNGADALYCQQTPTEIIVGEMAGNILFDITNPKHTESIHLTPNRTRAARDASVDVSGARYERGMIKVPRFHRLKLKMVRPLTGTTHHICLGLH
jgi:hypothetical protein